METHKKLSDNFIAKEVKEIVYEYVKMESISDTRGEKLAEEFFIKHFSKNPYFQENKELYGTYAIDKDPLDRAVCWAMVKGSGKETIAFVHHYDVVTVEDFKLLAPYAFSPDELFEEIKKIKSTLSPEVQEDIDSEKYLFGRGACDMKGGGSIQMALIDYYSKIKDFKGNLIVLGVPDEENLSAGMRAAVLLLDELQEKYNLDYKLMVNSEPHQRKDPKKGVFSLGSIGKLMPFVYVRGVLAHAGKVFEGLNPSNIMGEIVRNTELNMDFSDTINNEAAPPPTWLYLRDNKISYDCSMPLTVTGCLSVLTLNQMPKMVLDRLEKVCIDAFNKVIDDMNVNYRKFREETKQSQENLPWKTKVVDFNSLYMEAYEAHGEEFEKQYTKKVYELKNELERGATTIIAANFALVDFVYDYVDDVDPKVVYGLIPPYYPNVSNIFLDDKGKKIDELCDKLEEFIKESYDQEYDHEYFYTGISDLSYTSMKNSKDVIKALEEAMPFFGKLYDLPLETIEKISMPCINIGPWGKDFHKLTERVYKEDLYERTPRIINYAIEHIFNKMD